MFEKTKEFAHNALTKGKLAVGSAAAIGSAAVMSVASFAEGTTTNTFSVPNIADSITTDMMSGIMSQITSLLPVVLPVLVGVLAFRKGLSFFIGMIRGL